MGKLIGPGRWPQFYQAISQPFFVVARCRQTITVSKAHAQFGGLVAEIEWLRHQLLFEGSLDAVRLDHRHFTRENQRLPIGRDALKIVSDP